MCKIIACVNEKGGVAKTTTIKNLSVGVAAHGKRVLAIDLDASMNLSVSLGVNIIPNETVTILDGLQKIMNIEEIPENYGVIHHEEGIDIIPSTRDLHKFETVLLSADHREVILRELISHYQEKYDYIFLDCPAGLGIYVSNALYSADSLIIPVQPQFLGYGAMQNLLVKIKTVWHYNGTNNTIRKPEIMGILFTMVKPNTNNDKMIMEGVDELLKANGINIFETYIPNSVRFSESDGEQQSIYKFAPKSTSAAIYEQLVNEFMAIEMEKED